MGKTVSWLHLSDIHYNIQNYSSVVLREKLFALLREKVAIAPIDIIIISGDITFRGASYSKDVTSFIKEIIHTCNLTENELVIVPGNHDVKRTSARESIVKDIQERSEYSDFDPSHRDALLNGQKAFFSFYKKIKNIKGKTEFELNEHFVVNIGGLNLVCLNTALTCGRDKEEGFLKIDLQKLHQSISKLPANDGQINVAIGHHALDCFSEIDRERIFHEFEDHNILLYLCGHSHLPSASVNADGSKHVETIICGAGFQEDYGKAGCILGALNQEQQNGRVEFFCWDNKNQQWIIDNTIGRNVKNGKKIISFTKSDTYSEGFVSLDESELQRFVINFQQVLQISTLKASTNENDIPIAIYDKFKKMKCNQALRKQFNAYSIYFPIIQQIMENPQFSYSARLLVTGEIVSEYNVVLGKYTSGELIFESIISNLVLKYKSALGIESDKLSLYFRALAFWCIYECDIFDDEK